LFSVQALFCVAEKTPDTSGRSLQEPVTAGSIVRDVRGTSCQNLKTEES
jgi:hypothetical protein